MGIGIVELLVGVLVVVAAMSVVTVVVLLQHRSRAADREHDLHTDLQEQRQDIERRENRLGEREERLDVLDAILAAEEQP